MSRRRSRRGTRGWADGARQPCHWGDPNVINAQHRKWRSFARHWPWYALPGALLGCASPSAPPAPPSGGAALHLDYASFASAVEPILVNHGCDAEGDCHGGGIRGTLQLSPASAPDAQYDFNQVVLQVTANAPDQSPLLTRPLSDSAGGTAHPYKVFADTSDSEWRTIRAWVRAGVTP